MGFDDTIDHVDIECIAENDAGKAVSTYRTVVTYPSTTTSHMDVEQTTIADFGESKEQRKPLSKTVLREETQTKELRAKPKDIKENERIESTEKEKTNEIIKEGITSSNKDEELIKSSHVNKEETHKTKDNKDEGDNKDEDPIENKEVNFIEMDEIKEENSERLVQISENNYDDYMSSYEETSSDQYDDYSSDYLEKPDDYTYDTIEDLDENYDNYVSEKSDESNLDSQINVVDEDTEITIPSDILEESAATFLNWTDGSKNTNNDGTFVQLTNDYADSNSKGENTDAAGTFVQLTNDYADSMEGNADERGNLVQLNNDYDDSIDDSNFFENADSSKTGGEDSQYLDDFIQEAVDEPVFLQSESENSNMALKSSMNIENAAQVSEMLFPVSGGRQLTVEFFTLLLLICLLNVIFYTNFILII